MDSQTIYSQIMENQKAMDPYLSNQGIAPQYFDDRLNQLFQYNLPAIQNAAGLEARAYALPGELMDQYDQEYGGKMGIGSMDRMNSILKNIGMQFGTSNAAWNLVDQAKLRQSEMADKMLKQYTAELGAHKDKAGMLTPLWQQLYGEEQAMARLQAQMAASKKSNPTSTWNNIPGFPTNTPTEAVPGPSGSAVPNSLSRMLVNREEAKAPANTGSDQLNRLINNYMGNSAANLIGR